MLQFMLRAAESGRDGNKDSSGQEVWRLMSTKTRCPIEVNDDEGCWEVGISSRWKRRSKEGLRWLGRAKRGSSRRLSEDDANFPRK